MSSLLIFDQRITDFLYLESTTEALRSTLFVAASGFIYVLPIVLLIMFFRSHRDRLTSMKIFVSAILAWQGLSRLVGEVLYGEYGFRDRPFADNGFTELLFEQPEKAFPSDHAAVITAAALSFFIYKYPKLGYLFLILGLIGSIARVVIGFHWFGDVIGGFLLGVLAVGIVWVLDKPITRFFEWLIQRFSKRYGR